MKNIFTKVQNWLRGVPYPGWLDSSTAHPEHVTAAHAYHRGDRANEILALLSYDYPDPAFALPRGAIARVAHELGCSRSYASKVARNHGYHVSGMVRH